MKQIWLVWLVLGLSAVPVGAQTSIEVRGLDGVVQQIALTGLPTQQVAVRENLFKHEYGGVLLRDVLTKAGVQMGEHLRGPAMRRYAVAVGKDGYRVVIALPEVDSGFTDESIIVASSRDGHPLIPDHGPLRLIVPGDKRGARWVRQVVRIEIHEAP
jgi:DMSO/TMAO reductase YedYZ molybdopterin-dependent catalytic subunit